MGGERNSGVVWVVGGLQVSAEEEVGREKLLAEDLLIPREGPRKDREGARMITDLSREERTGATRH